MSIIEWIKNNKRELIIVGCTAVVVGLSMYFLRGREIVKLNRRISDLADALLEQKNICNGLRELCSAKDAAHLEPASDALRHGSSLGAQELVGWREFIKAA